MITIKDINKAIISQVKDGLINTAYKNIDFRSKAIKRSIPRPSFYLEFAGNKTGLFDANNKERTTIVKINYFPQDRSNYKIELMEVQEYLSNIFLKYVKIDEEFYVNVEELDSEIVDGVLICTMKLYVLEDISEETFEDTVHSTVDENKELIESIEITN